MKTILLPLLAFVIGFLAAAGYQYARTLHTPTPANTTTSPVVSQPIPEPTFALEPPTQALSGTLTVTSGHAQKYSRNDTEYKEASTGAQILIGESIATKANSTATAEVSGIVKANLGPTSELVFANLFANDFVLLQKDGKIDYTVTKPISVRALHTLVTINPGLPAQAGETIITIIDTDMSITVKTGSVKFALVDNDNNTGVWNLKAGERANIDDAASKVYLVK